MRPRTIRIRAEDMSSNEKARVALIIALVLLGLSGIGASVAIVQLYLTEGWVRHTYTVELALGDLDSVLAGVGRARISYVQLPGPESFRDFKEATEEVPVALARIRSLTNDNRTEQALCDQLQQNADRRVAPSVQSVQLAQQNQSDSSKQMQLTVEVGQEAIETAGLVQKMRSNEDKLLAQRSHLTKLLFAVTIGILIVSFSFVGGDVLDP